MDVLKRSAPLFNPAIAVAEINGEGKHLLPGAIDDQVHFREPGLTHKASIYTESKAAVAGGVTPYGNAQHSTTCIYPATAGG